MKIETTDTPAKTDVEILISGLNDHNYSVAPRDWCELGVFVRSDEDEILAGAYGASVWDWVHLKFLWVHASHRESGLGTQIMVEVEKEASLRKCIGIHLDTFSFQALPFYQKLGFEVFGVIDAHPAEHKRYYLKKSIQAIRPTTVKQSAR